MLEAMREVTPAMLAAKGLAQLPEAPDAGLIRNELREKLSEALKTIPAQYERTLRMYYFEELPIEEIAARLDVGKTRVHQIINRGLRLLRHPTRTNRLKPFIEP